MGLNPDNPQWSCKCPTIVLCEAMWGKKNRDASCVAWLVWHEKRLMAVLILYCVGTGETVFLGCWIECTRLGTNYWQLALAMHVSMTVDLFRWCPQESAGFPHDTDWAGGSSGQGAKVLFRCSKPHLVEYRRWYFSSTCVYIYICIYDSRQYSYPW